MVLPERAVCSFFQFLSSDRPPSGALRLCSDVQSNHCVKWLQVWIPGWIQMLVCYSNPCSLLSDAYSVISTVTYKEVHCSQFPTLNAWGLILFSIFESALRMTSYFLHCSCSLHPVTSSRILRPSPKDSFLLSAPPRPFIGYIWLPYLYSADFDRHARS